MTKKIIKFALIVFLAAASFAAIYYIYWPFALKFILHKFPTGDAYMHLANVVGIAAHHPFPIMAWKVEWGGYPLIEGYPWLHYYLLLPFVQNFANPGVAIDNYMAIFLLFYYLTAFGLLFYVSKNALLALFSTIVVIYGADSQMPMTVNAFMTFASSQFFLPLMLLLVIIARDKSKPKLLLFSAAVLSLAFISHGAMTTYVIFPVILPFIVLDKQGKITKVTIADAFRFFFIFGFLSLVQIYQFVSYSAQGYLRGVKPFALEIIPERFVYLLSWMNPALLPLLAIFVFLLILAAKKHFLRLKPYLLSLSLILLVFTLMLFNITSMNLVLLAERVLWAISLVFFVNLAIFVKVLTGGRPRLNAVVWVTSGIFIFIYLYLVLVMKPTYLVPDTLKPLDPYSLLGKKFPAPSHIYENKFEPVYAYPKLSWDKSFTNYRIDGISWSIYSNWNIWSTTNIRYKGRFPAAKDLPLEWSGLVGGAEYGMLGEAGSKDDSPWAINQSLFFFDWYGIRYLEHAENDAEMAKFLLEPPLAVSSEKSLDLVYTELDKELIGPMYAATNAKTIAVVAPEIHYHNIIRTLSYSDLRSDKIIPIYLGPNLNAINKNNLRDFDGVFLYGFKESLLSASKWNLLTDYVKDGGSLLVDTGQKGAKTENQNLPEVFPVTKTKMAVVEKPVTFKLEDNEITKGADIKHFSPLLTKYLPYAISQAKVSDLKNWAKSVLSRDGAVVIAYGQFGKGKVFWSGINLPFHAIDNRNTSETVILANAIKYIFPEEPEKITNYQVEHPNGEKITVKAGEGKGFIIKENYNSGWRVTLNGKKVRVYRGGLMQMYIPRNSGEGDEVLKLVYKGYPLHWLLFGISAAGLLLLLVYLITGKNVLPGLQKIKQRLPVKQKKAGDGDYD